MRLFCSRTSKSAKTKSPRMDEDELEIDDGARALGKGGYGFVVVGRYMRQNVAVKVIPLGERCIRREIAAFRRVGPHVHVIELLGQTWDATHSYIVLALANKDLFCHVVEHNFLCEEEARCYFGQMLAAVAFIHSRRVVHRDIKLENWLICGNVIKLADFGLAHVYDDHAPDDTLHDFVGTMSYAAPHIISRISCGGYACDAWSMAVCLFAMVTGFFPYERAHPSDPRFQRFYGKTSCVVSAFYEFHGRSRRLSPDLCHLLHKSIGVAIYPYTISKMRDHAWVRDERREKTEIRETVDPEPAFVTPPPLDRINAETMTSIPLSED